jgi:hypothetical protein
MVRKKISRASNLQIFFTAWYDTNRFIAGTSNGHVCVLFNGDVQTEIDVLEGRERPTTT